MSEFIVPTRAIHFCAVLWLFGEFVLFGIVVRPVVRRVSGAASADSRDAERRLIRVASGCMAISVASAIAWLLLEAAAMSGTPLAVALDRSTLDTVIRETLFGRIWAVRLGLSLFLGAALWLAWRQRLRHAGRLLKIVGALLAGAYAATLAGTGHAVAETGADRYIHLTTDAVHLLAAGAWVGALPGLLAFFKRAGNAARPDTFALAASAAQRFSTVGIVCVSALVLTGLVNSWYLVGSVPALLGTEYGTLLMWKLLLFASMLILAAINRLSLTPQLATSRTTTIDTPGRSALTRLRRNTLLELAAGVAIVCIVAALGVKVPAVHMFHGRHPHPMTSKAAFIEHDRAQHLDSSIRG